MYSLPENLEINSTDKFYFTCPSYGFITPILSIIDEIIYVNPEINIIVMDVQMRSFWHQLTTAKGYKWNLIFLNTSPPGRFRNVLSWLMIRAMIRQLYEENFKSISGAYFYCCGYASDLILFALIKMIASQNTVVFLNIHYAETKLNFSLKALVLLLHAWLIYRLDVTIRSFDFNKSPKVWLSERFFKKFNIELHEFKYFYNNQLLAKYNSIPFSYISGKKILLLADDCLFYEAEKKDQVRNTLKSIKKIIDDNFCKYEVLYKPHPNSMFHSKDADSIFDDYEKLPSFMNADFIIANSNIKFILGSISAVLSTAAKHTHIVAVSYLKMMPFKDEKIKKSMIELWSNEAGGGLVNIDSLEGLEFILKK